MSPLVWDLGHIAAYEDLWLGHRYGGRPLLRPDLAAVYDAFETPRTVRADARLLDAPAARCLLEGVRARTLEVLDVRGPDPVLHEMVARHELQHTETMAQALRLGGLPTPGVSEPAPVDGSGLDLDTVPAGSFDLGASGTGFAFDNERPRHTVELPAFGIGRTPVTNASWLTFTEGGGYERREWWSDEGWGWKEDYDISGCPDASTGRPDAPVCHVSWFEAEAFATAHGLRLPREAEWERAAASGAGLAGVGQVWEWTASEFRGYPGFVASPYREYSEVFFGRGYRVLRGWSRATHARAASVTFRNWDLPARRQLFAGLRLAGDA
jgi:iron(II)-dependent oxidoreductase